MTNTFFIDEVNAAHSMIIQGGLVEAVRRLKILEHRIHDPKLLSKVEMFRNEHDRELDKKIKEIEDSDADPFRKDHLKREQIYKYAINYLTFFSKLTHDSDLF